jgi:hypothetical protein
MSGARSAPPSPHGRRLVVSGDDLPLPIPRTAEEAAMLREMFQELVSEYVDSPVFKLIQEARHER